MSMARKIFGVGGIGKGIFFESSSNLTLGRNESRLMTRSGCRDYCKLHIVFHYIARFLPDSYRVIPCGIVGNDADGTELKDMMRTAGMDISFVRTDSRYPTMLSVCIQYPDKSGGNITSSNSACSLLTSRDVLRTLDENNIGKDDIVAALPEVSLESRLTLLKEGRARGAYCAASFAPTEAVTFQNIDVLDSCDLLALNQEEAAAFTGVSFIETLEQAESCAQKILRQAPHLHLWLTMGSRGSVSADKDCLRYYSALPVEVCSTGGAGDATLAGILAGLALGMPFQRNEESSLWGAAPFNSAAELGVLIGGISVSSEDSIDLRLCPEYILDYIFENGWKSEYQNYFKRRE